MKLKPFDDLVKILTQFSGIGEKSAYKIAIDLIQKKDILLDKFINVLNSFNTDIQICKECGFLTYKSDLCEICSDNSRNKNLILIVSKIEDIFVFENLNFYDGLYHVLGGLISPLSGITPTDLSIDKLLNRLQKHRVNEIILGLPKTSYGEITSYFIKDIVNRNFPDIKISSLAQGISSEIDLNNLNPNTLISSLKNRIKF